jgi:hypothetical protein
MLTLNEGSLVVQANQFQIVAEKTLHFVMTKGVTLKDIEGLANKQV